VYNTNSQKKFLQTCAISSREKQIIHTGSKLFLNLVTEFSSFFSQKLCRSNRNILLYYIHSVRFKNTTIKQCFGQLPILQMCKMGMKMTDDDVNFYQGLFGFMTNRMILISSISKSYFFGCIIKNIRELEVLQIFSHYLQTSDK
jgi:hypothetical protein